MRIAAIYDIHGNLPALEAVLAEIADSSVDLILVGGDVVAGPMPAETLQRLLSLEQPVEYIRGNADRAVVEAWDGDEPAGVPAGARHVVRWVASQLGRHERDLLASWPLTRTFDVDRLGPVLFCHASPRNDTDIFTRATPEATIAPLFVGVAERTVVQGHTHMQFDRQVAGKRLLNAGSVGMPYGERGAFWLLLGPDAQLRRTAYDLERAAEAVRATGFPDAEKFATRNILSPPSEDEALAVFERSHE